MCHYIMDELEATNAMSRGSIYVMNLHGRVQTKKLNVSGEMSKRSPVAEIMRMLALRWLSPTATHSDASGMQAQAI